LPNKNFDAFHAFNLPNLIPILLHIAHIGVSKKVVGSRHSEVAQT
jgi:hypothetical protein